MTIREIILAHVQRYTAAYLAAAGYAVLASLGAFIDIFSSLTREQAAALPWWSICALVAKCINPGLAAVLAFLNQSLSKANTSATNPPFPKP